MTNNNIFDIIGNCKDELERAYDLLKDNEDALNTMLLQDMEFSIDELDELGDRISFALILAVYTAYLNAESGYEDSCDNSV